MQMESCIFYFHFSLSPLKWFSYYQFLILIKYFKRAIIFSKIFLIYYDHDIKIVRRCF